MTVAVGALLLAGVLALCQAEAGGREIRRLVERQLPHWDAERQRAFASGLVERIPWHRWPVEDHARILSLVWHELEFTLGAATYNEYLWDGTLRDCPQAVTQGLPRAPAALREQAEALAMRALDALVEEVFSAPLPSEDELSRMREQLGTIEQALCSEARRVVVGPYREDVIKETIVEAADQIRSRLGKPLSRTPYRSLTLAELTVVLDGIHETARSLPLLYAESDPAPESDIAPQELGGANGTRAALAGLFALRKQLYQWHRFCYPRLCEADAAADRLGGEVRSWRKGMMEELNRRETLHNAGALQRMAQDRERRGAASRTGGNTVAEPASLPSRPSPSPDGQPTTGRVDLRWGATLGLLVLSAVTAYVLLRARARRRTTTGTRPI